MSKIIAIMPCRNSAWCLGLTARALLMFCDEIVLLNHASLDATIDIIYALQLEYPGRVNYRALADPVWREMAHRQMLLEVARERGASHIVILDDDEIITGNLLERMRQLVETTPRGSLLELPWLQLRGSIDAVHTTGLWGQARVSSAFPDRPEYCWRAREGYDHHHRHPMGAPYVPYAPLRDRSAGVMHLQMASNKRLRWKQYLYKLIERKRWPEKRTPEQLNAMYDPTVNSVQGMGAVPAAWWEPYQSLLCHLHLDAEPWQRAEVLRMLAEEPGLADGLTTYGLEVA